MENQYLKAIEQLNKEYIEYKREIEPIYSMGAKLYKLKAKFPFGLLELYKNRMKWKKINKKIEKLSVKCEDKIYANEGCKVIGSKGVTYTCVTGKYDNVCEPLLEIDGMDYIFLSDLKNLISKNWKLKEVEKIPNMPPNQTNRFFKLNPDIAFKNYDYSIYIDGNVRVVSDITGLYSIARNSKVGIAMHKHPDRDCIFDEGEACILYERGDKERINRQLTSYEKEGMPHHFGLLEATIIVVDFHNPTAIRLMHEWWNQFEFWGSGRDQLSFPYVLWKNGFDLNDVGILGNNKYENYKFRIEGHNK